METTNFFLPIYDFPFEDLPHLPGIKRGKAFTTTVVNGLFAQTRTEIVDYIDHVKSLALQGDIAPRLPSNFSPRYIMSSRREDFILTKVKKP